MPGLRTIQQPVIQTRTAEHAARITVPRRPWSLSQAYNAIDEVKDVLQWLVPCWYWFSVSLLQYFLLSHHCFSCTSTLCCTLGLTSASFCEMSLQILFSLKEFVAKTASKLVWLRDVSLVVEIRPWQPENSHLIFSCTYEMSKRFPVFVFHFAQGVSFPLYFEESSY